MDQNDSGFINSLYNEIQETEQRLEILNQVRETYEGGMTNGGGNNGGGTQSRNRGNQGGSNRGSNSSNRGGNSGGRQSSNNRGNQGRANFSGGPNDASDGRTTAGRQQDDQDFTQDQLMEFIQNPDQNDLNEDNSFDLRTKVGRALQAAGLIDDDGFPIEGNQGGGNTRSRGRQMSNSGR